MAFNPLTEKGTPIDKQVRSLSELNPQPYDKNKVHPFTRTRIILMNGIEVEGAIFSHQFHRHCNDSELKQKLATSRRLEQQQQKAINWMPPPDESPLEVTIGYEQVAVELTSQLAKHEKDPNVKAALDFALLEDFDHLYRYANLLDSEQGMQAEKIVGGLTEIMPGRPTMLEHCHPMDTVQQHYDKMKADPMTKLHVLTITAAEQQTMNYYMNIGGIHKTPLGKGLYAEIAQIEEQHVTHYGSLGDPNETWFERWLFHEYNECWLYFCLAQEETDKRVKGLWERHLLDEIEHLKVAADAFKHYERRDPMELLPASLPAHTIFESNKEYVREILRSQVDLRTHQTKYVPVDKLPKDDRYFKYQSMINADGTPSQDVIKMHIEQKQTDYRLQTEGDHPIERLRSRQRPAA